MALAAEFPQLTYDVTVKVEHLVKYEDRLDLLPDWLGFLKRFQTIKAINGFAGIYWFYQQIWLLGHEGRTDPGFAVFKAFRLVDARGKRIMKQRRALL